MKLSGEYIAGAVGLVFAAMFAWFGALWLNLQGATLWFARVCIFLLLALAVLAIVWWLGRKKKEEPSEESPADSESATRAGATDDILLILREAEARVASSTQLPRGTRLSSLPMIFLVGGSSSGKTCVAAQSGLDPELISGHVYQEGKIAPTRLANLWFARKAVFVEMGGKTLGDANLWNRLLHRISPGNLRSIFSSKPAAPRAAVVCYDSTRFAQAATSEEIIAEARVIRARLQQIALTLGISFPVYVLFTQADRLPYFEDFFRNLSDMEITQVFGVTVSPFPATASGVYAEQETKRLTNAFNSMFHSLAECRPGLLYRERNADKLPGIYEFPRELQKRIPVATQFLVDLCRPSHLRSGPFLRGFYFTGVRQVETAAPLGGTIIAPKTSLTPTRTLSSNATSLMRAEDFARTQGWQSATQTGLGRESGKTLQWLFLSHIFSHVILQDRAALGASGSSSRANVLKRLILTTVSALAAIWFLGMIISFFENRALEQDVRRAAEAVIPIKTQAPSMASLEELERLEAARVQLARLTEYYRVRTPLRFRWGLYSGDDVYSDFRALYFDRFNKLLLAGVRTRLADSLRTLPTSARPSDEWQPPYETLKAYLITTSRPEKSTRAFLSSVLLNRWAVGGAVDEQRLRLARAQFDFYADELRIENPFSFPEEDSVVLPGRRFLNSFSTGPQLVYQKLLARTNQAVPPFSFAQRYPDAKDVVAEPKIVDGTFTSAGWKMMTSAISHPENYAAGDDWVLGTVAGSRASQNVSAKDVRALYEAEYKKRWREYLKSASVIGLGDPAEASKKLEKLTGNRSPLFELLCEVSENTAGTSNEIASAFQPVSDVVKYPCYNLVAQDTTKAYVSALSEFKLCIDRNQENASDPPTKRDDAYKSCQTQQIPVVEREGSNAVKTVDHEADLDKCVVSLLKLGGCSPGKVSPQHIDLFCSALLRLSAKYPFKNDSTEDATLEEFENFFRPGTGILSREIASGGMGSRRANLLRQGESMQKSLYPTGGAKLEYHFIVTTIVPSGMKSAQLDLDGKVLRVSEGASGTESFVWPGKTQEAELRFGDSKYLGPFDGPWAVFRLLRNNYNWSSGKGASHLESSPLKSPQGLTFKHFLELKTEGVPLFRPGYLSKLRCSAQPATR